MNYNARVMVVGVREHVYNAVKRYRGDRYEADPKFLPIMLGLGWVTVEEAPVLAETDVKPGRYNRRDMRAKH